MPNNVDTHIEFNAINSDALTNLKEIFSNPPEYESGYTHLDYVMMRILDIKNDSEFDSDETMGSKWVYVEESCFEVGNCYLRLVSAWDTPIQAIKILFSYISKSDQNLVLSLRYDDGGHDFGWMVFSKKGHDISISGEYLDRSDLVRIASEEDPEFAKMDEEDEQYEEFLEENFYEFFHSYVSPKIREAIAAV